MANVACRRKDQVGGAVGIGTNSGAAGATLAVTTTALAPAGSTVFVAVDEKAISGTASVSDGTISFIKDASGNFNGSNHVSLWRRPATTSLANGSTITITRGTSGVDCAGAVFYGPGVQAPDGLAVPLDTAGALTAGNSTSPSGAVATIDGPDLIVGIMGCRGGITITQPGAPWLGGAKVEVTDDNLSWNHQRASTPGTFTYNPTIDVSNPWAIIVVGYRAQVQMVDVLVDPTLDDNGWIEELTQVKNFWGDSADLDVKGWFDPDLVTGTVVTNKTLAADAGSYSFTGTNATLRINRPIVADAGSYALTGTAAVLRHGWKVPAAAGSYALTGTAAGLKHGWKVPAAVGSYSLTGTDVMLKINRPLVAGAGSYVLTGTDAVLRHGWKIAAAAGNYALTGTAAGLKHGWKVPAGIGSYALTGTDVVLRINRPLVAGAGSYTLTGTAAGLEHGWKIAAAAGSYTLTGTDAALRQARKIAAAAGSYAFTGTDAALIKSGTGKVLAADAGSYAFTGTDATLKLGRKVAAAAGAYALTGAAAALKVARRVTVDGGIYTLTGGDADLIISGVTPPEVVVVDTRGGILPEIHVKKRRPGPKPPTVRETIERLLNPPVPMADMVEPVAVLPHVRLTAVERTQIMSALMAVPEQQLLDYGVQDAVWAAARLVRQLEQDDEDTILMILATIIAQDLHA